MAYIFDNGMAHPFEQKVSELEQEIKRFTRACQSDWPRPIDYTNLIDAQCSLKALKDCYQGL